MSVYLTLPSDASMGYFPDNRISRFRTYLPEVFKLNGPYEVGLAEISYPRSWDNIREDCLITLTESIVSDSEINLSTQILLPKGYYGSVTELLEVLTFEVDISQNIMPGVITRSEKPVRFEYIEHRRRVAVTLKENYSMSIPAPLAILLGFTRNGNEEFKITGYKLSDYTIDLDTGLHSLFIYSDIVENRSVGDFDVPLLRIVSVQGKDGETVDRDFIRPHYLPVASNAFQTIEISIMSEMGVPVQFERGKVHVTLHFRPRRMWTSL